MMLGPKRVPTKIAILMLAMALPQPVLGYATFTHEELIDLAWNHSIRPLLLQRYPGTTDNGLVVAHSYAYGGCLIQDLGYYPFGKKLFSDLTHYVRSADFVEALLRNARNVDELAFAIGALSHYVGDIVGHAEAVNPSTGIAFPKLERKYGPLVTFEDDPIAHVRTEFGFDIAQIALWRYAPHQYRKTIGFRMSRRLLERAFQQTYGLRMGSILGPPRSALSSYDLAVHRLIPLFAKATIVDIRRHLPPDPPDTALDRLSEAISETDYAKHFGQYHHGPGFEARVLGIVIHLVPKIGILKILAIKAPSEQTEDLFVESLDHALSRFEVLLSDLANNQMPLADRDLDTGLKVRPGGYKLTDRTYAELLHRLVQTPGVSIPPDLRRDILAYYSDPAAPISTKHNPKAWMRVLAELNTLEHSAEHSTADNRASP
jgi:hypothetical protein